MAIEQRIIRKSLAGEEDILLGKGQVTQSRNGLDYQISRINVVKLFDSAAEMAADKNLTVNQTVELNGSTYRIVSAGTGTADGVNYIDLTDHQAQLLRAATVVFDTAADMIAALTLAVGQTVRTLGYYVVGDGGSNDYEIVATATGTDDGGSYIDLDTHQAKGLFVSGTTSVKQFGAKGDKVNNDTAAIQAAIDSLSAAGGVLNIPTGTYYVTATIAVTFDNLFIQGGGEGCSLYREGDYGHTINVSDPLALNTIRGFNIQNIALDSEGLTTSGAHLYMDAVRWFRVENIHMKDGYRGLEMLGCAAGVVSQVYLVLDELFGGTTTGRYYCYLHSSANASKVTHPHGGDVMFESCNFRGSSVSNVVYGIYITSSDGYWFNNCHVGQTLTNNVLISASLPDNLGGLRFNNCWFDKCDGAGIKITGTTPSTSANHIFNGCIIKGGSTGTIGVIIVSSFATGVVFTDCQIREFTEHGIDIRASFTGSVSFNNTLILNCSTGNTGVHPAVQIANSVDDVKIIGGEIAGADHAQAIQIDGTSHDNLHIDGVVMVNNAVASPVMDVMTGTNSRQTNNAGFNPQGFQETLTVGVSPFTYTNNKGMPLMVSVGGGTVSVIANGAIGYSAITSGLFLLQNGESMTVTYSATPQMRTFGV